MPSTGFHGKKSSPPEDNLIDCVLSALVLHTTIPRLKIQFVAYDQGIEASDIILPQKSFGEGRHKAEMQMVIRYCERYETPPDRC